MEGKSESAARHSKKASSKPGPQRRPRLYQVAAEAGVSIATVSRVAKGGPGVSAPLRQQVMRAAQRLGANLDQHNHSRIVAFLLSNRSVLQPFHSSILVGAESYCAAHGYGVLFLPLQYETSTPWRDLHVPQLLMHREFLRAVIVAGTNAQNLLDLLDHHGLPYVVFGNNVVGEWKREDISAVYFDDLSGAVDAARYLISLGHRAIAFVGNSRRPWYARRYQGYCQAMEEAGYTPRFSDVDSDDREDLGYLATKPLLNTGQPLTAIMAGDDATARGVYKALHDVRLRIPHDISVIGFNDSAEAGALSPGLTSVRVFTDQLGKRLAELVLKRIARPELKPQTVTIPTRLVKRESCRPLLQSEGW